MERSPNFNLCSTVVVQYTCSSLSLALLKFNLEKFDLNEINYTKALAYVAVKWHDTHK